MSQAGLLASAVSHSVSVEQPALTQALGEAAVSHLNPSPQSASAEQRSAVESTQNFFSPISLQLVRGASVHCVSSVQLVSHVLVCGLQAELSSFSHSVLSHSHFLLVWLQVLPGSQPAKAGSVQSSC